MRHGGSACAHELGFGMAAWEMKECGVDVVVGDAAEGEEERGEDGESDGEVGAGDEEFG